MYSEKYREREGKCRTDPGYTNFAKHNERRVDDFKHNTCSLSLGGSWAQMTRRVVGFISGGRARGFEPGCRAHGFVDLNSLVLREILEPEDNISTDEILGNKALLWKGNMS